MRKLPATFHLGPGSVQSRYWSCWQSPRKRDPFWCCSGTPQELCYTWIRVRHSGTVHRDIFL